MLVGVLFRSCQVLYPNKIWIYPSLSFQNALRDWICVFPKFWICVFWRKFWRTFGVRIAALRAWGQNKMEGGNFQISKGLEWVHAGKMGMWMGFWDGILGCGKEFWWFWNSQRSSIPGSAQGLEPHEVLEGVGWDEMLLKILPNPIPSLIWDN